MLGGALTGDFAVAAAAMKHDSVSAFASVVHVVVRDEDVVAPLGGDDTCVAKWSIRVCAWVGYR